MSAELVVSMRKDMGEAVASLPVDIPEGVTTYGLSILLDMIQTEQELTAEIQKSPRNAEVLSAKREKLRLRIREWFNDYGLTPASHAKIRRQLGLSPTS
jgi:hypothetical protein